MATKYVSKRRTLYKRVFISTILFAVTIAIYAMFFMVPQVTISFNTNVDEFAIPSISTNAGEAIGKSTYDKIKTSIVGNEKVGYVFDKWYVNGIPLTEATVFEKDSVVEAVWTPKRFTLQIDLNGGQYSGDLNAVFNEIVRFDEILNIPSGENFYKDIGMGDNLVLKEWRIIEQIQGDYTSVRVGESFKLDKIKYFWLTNPEPVGDVEEVIYGTLKLKAEWKQQDVIVRFMSIDSTYLDVAVIKGTTIPVNDIPSFSSPSHNFVSWFLDEEGTQPINLNTHVFFVDTIIYSTWEPKNFTVTFNSLGGSIVPSQTVKYNEKIFDPQPPVKQYYRFVGWNRIAIIDNVAGPDPLGNDRYNYFGSRYDFNTPVTGSFMLYAEWELNYDYGDDFTPALWFSTTPIGTTGNLRIIGLSSAGKSATSIKVPLYINNPSARVTEIAQDVFSNMPNCTQIIISPNITFIDPRAFGDTPKLSKIIVWSTNTSYVDIDGVLYSKDYKTLIKYPAGKTNTSLVVGTEGRVVNTIGKYAFSKANKLKNVEINVTKIDDYAFNACESLESVTITEKVTEIGTGIFANCLKLANIEVNDNNSNYSADEFGLYTYGFDTLLFYKLTNLSNSLSIRNETKKIDSWAFINNTNLQTINTNNVEIIEEYAFAEMSNLSVVNLNDNVQTIGRYAFVNCVALHTITLARETSNYPLDSYIFEGCSNLDSVRVYAGSAGEEYMNFVKSSGAVSEKTEIIVIL